MRATLLCWAWGDWHIHIPMALWITKPIFMNPESMREERRRENLVVFFLFFFVCVPFSGVTKQLLEKPWVSGGEFIGTVLKRRAPERDLMLRCGAPGPRPGTSSTDQRLSQRRKGWRETYAKFALFFNFSMSGLHSACLEDVWPLSLWTPYMPLGPQAKWLVYESNG